MTDHPGTPIDSSYGILSSVQGISYWAPKIAKDGKVQKGVSTVTAERSGTSTSRHIYIGSVIVRQCVRKDILALERRVLRAYSLDFV